MVYPWHSSQSYSIWEEVTRVENPPIVSPLAILQKVNTKITTPAFSVQHDLSLPYFSCCMYYHLPSPNSSKPFFNREVCPQSRNFGLSFSYTFKTLLLKNYIMITVLLLFDKIFSYKTFFYYPMQYHNKLTPGNSIPHPCLSSIVFVNFCVVKIQLGYYC